MSTNLCVVSPTDRAFSFTVTRYPVMAVPPFAGADQAFTATVPRTITEKRETFPGVVAGTTGAEVALTGESPVALVAATVNV